MEPYEVVRQAVKLLQEQGRLTYRMLKRQFNLDDEALEDVKDELLFSHPVVDETGKGLVWTGEADTLPTPDTQHEVDAEIRFHAILPVLTGLLQREGRKTYRELKHIFSLDDALLQEIQDALAFKRLAIDENSKGLVWTGNKQITGMIAPPDAISIDVSSKDPADTLEQINALLEAERRQLTVMFCDLADSTKLSQHLDPEDFREVVRAYQATATEVIHQYDGHIAQYLGDGVLIYFGWPVAHEDDAQRSLYAGLGIVEAIITTLNPSLQQEKKVQLTVRIGIHTGPVVVGEMGGGARSENLATGETVNIAARLEGLAAPNTVVLSSVTARLVAGAFALEELGQHELKGVAEPMAVFRVLAPTAVEPDAEDNLPDGGLFLVGRDEEVGLLLRRWKQSKEGVGQVVLISGEAGIGKSSLLATVRRHIADEGYTRLTFRCSPYHTNSVLYPVIVHLEHLLGFERRDTPDAKLDKLELALRHTVLPLEETVPLMAALLSVPCEDRDTVPTVSPQQQRQQTLDALVGWLLGAAEQQPVLTMWEDLHWADPSTLELLGLLLEQTPTVPMLHVLTFRPEFEPPWPSRSHMTPITLNRLERPQVEALIVHLAGGKTLPEEVAEHIVSKTDGVPLYVEALTRMLLESDLLRNETERYVLTGPLTTVAIPDTLQDSLMARLDQLGSAKEIAQLAAVLGREFSYHMLQALADVEETFLQTQLTHLVQAELLYQRGRPPQSRYIFKHALIQDAAYSSLLRSTRQQVHQRVAQMLEKQFPETVDTQPELLAHHYTEAGRIEQAVSYWQQAGQRANEHSTLMEAMGNFRKGLEVIPRLPETPERIQREVDLLISLGQVLGSATGGATPERGRVLNRARELCQHLGDTTRRITVLEALFSFHGVSGQIQTCRELAEELFALAQPRQDPSELIVAHRALGINLFHRGGELGQARMHLEQAVALHDAQQDDSLLLNPSGVNRRLLPLGYLILTLWVHGYPDQALQRSHEALALARDLAHPYSLASVLIYVIRGAYEGRREFQNALACAQEIVAVCTKQGFAYLLPQGMILEGWALAMQGEVTHGIARICQGLDNFRAMEAELHLTYFHALIAQAYAKAGQTRAGLEAVADALTLAHRNGDRCYEAELYRLKGELLLMADGGGQMAELAPETCFQKALDITRQQQASSLELRAATSLARLWQSQGKRQEVYDLLSPVYGWFTEGFDTADLKDAKALLKELEA